MKNKLNRTLNLVDVTLATSGYIIGAGIYAILGIATKYGKQYTWIAILISGLFSICTGLSFSELSTIYNKNGTEYYIAKDVFNNQVATIISFITILAQVLTQSVVASGMSSHLLKIIPMNENILSSFLIILYGFINYNGIRNTANYNNVATILEISGLVAISLGGLNFIDSSVFDLTNFNFGDLMPIILSSSVINFAYFGYDMALGLTEETINPEKNIPLGMIYGIIIAIIVYLTTTISGLSSLGWNKLSQSNTPIMDIAKVMFGKKGMSIIFIIAIISMSNTLLMGNVSSSRFLQAYSKDNSLLKRLKLDYVDKKNKTPKYAILFITISSILLLFLVPDFDFLITFTNLAIFLIFIMMNLAVILLRVNKPNLKRKFKIPFTFFNIPISSVIAILIGLVSVILILKEKIDIF